jgi:calcineurin-like phosphoesterase family protein
MIWWTSDWHFMHNNVLRFCPNRVYSSIQEHDTAIINNINNVVKETDMLVVVGDISMGHKSSIRAIMQQIKCKNIVLVRGNHDKKNSIPTDCFTLIVERFSMIISGKPVLISHFPYKWPWWKSWMYNIKFAKYNVHNNRRPSDCGAFLIHGHTHSVNKYNKRMIHVGVDAWDMKPVPHSEIERAISKIIHQEYASKYRVKARIFYNQYYKRILGKLVKIIKKTI